MYDIYVYNNQYIYIYIHTYIHTYICICIYSTYTDWCVTTHYIKIVCSATTQPWISVNSRWTIPNPALSSPVLFPRIGFHLLLCSIRRRLLHPSNTHQRGNDTAVKAIVQVTRSKQHHPTVRQVLLMWDSNNNIWRLPEIGVPQNHPV